MRTPTTRAEAILDALPKEVVVGVYADLAELVERYFERAAERALNDDKHVERARHEARNIRAL